MKSINEEFIGASKYAETPEEQEELLQELLKTRVPTVEELDNMAIVDQDDMP